jgi:hypothetical protein
MPYTNIADVIVPAVFLPYVIQRTAQLSAFWESGVVGTDAQLQALASGGGQTVNMPFWNDLSGADEVLSDQAPLTPGSLTTAQDVAVFHLRARAWGDNDLAGLLAGDDPADAVAQLVAKYWARRFNQQIIQESLGVFASATMVTNSVDIHQATGAATAANQLNAITFINAKQLLGDNSFKLTAIAMHSDVEASLRKLDLIDFIPDSEGKTQITSFQGLRVIIDDSMPVQTINSLLTYDTILFGQGAFAHAEDMAAAMEPIPGGFGAWGAEFGRNLLAGQDLFASRHRYFLHPRGVKWLGPMAGAAPTNAELADGTKWQKVYETKNVRLVKIRHNVY